MTLPMYDDPHPAIRATLKRARTVTLVGLFVIAAVIAVASLGSYHLGYRRGVNDQDRTRHAICEVLDTLGADATTAEDVTACAA